MTATRQGYEADIAQPFEVPISAIADLTGQAVMVVDPEAQIALALSSRARDLFPVQKSLPISLAEMFGPDHNLTERLQLTLAMSCPLRLGVKARDLGTRISAKAQRIEFKGRPPLVLVSFEDEPELSKRLQTLANQILHLNQEILRRHEAERSLLQTSNALRRSLTVVRNLSEITITGGEHLDRAAEIIASALDVSDAVFVKRYGSYFFCNAQTGTLFKQIVPTEPLALNLSEAAPPWDNQPDERDALLLGALEMASGRTLDAAHICVIPITLAGKPEGAFIGVSKNAKALSGITAFEIGIIGEALMSLLIRSDMELRLNHGQKMEAIGHLTGSIAHDFNNILAVILGNAELIIHEESEDYRQLAEEIEDAAQRGSTLTSQLLAFARKQPLRPETVDAGTLVRDLNPIISRSVGEDIDLRIITADGLWNVVIDRHQIGTALLNLAINARDAMPDGGQLTIDVVNADLDEEYAAAHEEVKPGQYVMIGVSDTGTGMDPVTAEQAFTPFFTTKDVGKGSGLGLSMVYGFVKQSGGHVKIYSEPGHGTTVRMYLPRYSTEAERDNSDLTEVDQENGSQIGNVLIVEDDPAVMKLTARLLISQGFLVDTAKDGAEAIALLDQNSYLLLLTDVVLPGQINGRMVASYATAISPETSVLFMSGYPESAIVHQGRLDPNAKLISKPFTRLQLERKIKDLIKSSKGPV